MALKRGKHNSKSFSFTVIMIVPSCVSYWQDFHDHRADGGLVASFALYKGAILPSMHAPLTSHTGRHTMQRQFSSDSAVAKGEPPLLSVEEDDVLVDAVNWSAVVPVGASMVNTVQRP